MTDPEHEMMLSAALKYCRLRLLPFNELGYEETCEYSLRRSRLHNSLAQMLDADRELVERAFTESAVGFGVRTMDGIVVDGTLRDMADFTGIYDKFCKLLDGILELPVEERHPDELTDEKLDKMDFGGIQGIPDLTNVGKHNENTEREVGL